MALKDQADTTIVVGDDIIMGYYEAGEVQLISGEILSSEVDRGEHYLVVDKGAKARYAGDTARLRLTRVSSDYRAYQGIKAA
jgi:hypothetical protein